MLITKGHVALLKKMYYMQKKQTDFNQLIDENSKQAYAISVLFKILNMEIFNDSLIKNMNRDFLQLIYTALKGHEVTQADQAYHNTEAPSSDCFDFIKHLEYINVRTNS